MVKKVKKDDKRALTAKLQKLANLHARLRDCSGKDGGTNCISCGTYYEFAKFHGGHFIPSTKSAVRFEETNIHAQCISCNLFHHGNQINYMIAMEKRYGRQYVDELIEKSRAIKAWTVEELNELIEYYKTKIRNY